MHKDYLDMTVREILDWMEEVGLGKVAFEGPGAKGENRAPLLLLFCQRDGRVVFQLRGVKGDSHMTGEEATAMGYRRVSNSTRTVARIDREDWKAVLAKHLHRSVAELYHTASGEYGASVVSPMWCDYYRRCMSEDDVRLDPAEFRKVPGSDWDPCEYVPLPEK